MTEPLDDKTPEPVPDEDSSPAEPVKDRDPGDLPRHRRLPDWLGQRDD